MWGPSSAADRLVGPCPWRSLLHETQAGPWGPAQTRGVCPGSARGSAPLYDNVRRGTAGWKAKSHNCFAAPVQAIRLP